MNSPSELACHQQPVAGSPPPGWQSLASVWCLSAAGLALHWPAASDQTLLRQWTCRLLAAHGLSAKQRCLMWQTLTVLHSRSSHSGDPRYALQQPQQQHRRPTGIHGDNNRSQHEEPTSSSQTCQFSSSIRSKPNSSQQLGKVKNVSSLLTASKVSPAGGIELPRCPSNNWQYSSLSLGVLVEGAAVQRPDPSG